MSEHFYSEPGKIARFSVMLFSGRIIKNVRVQVFFREPIFNHYVICRINHLWGATDIGLAMEQLFSIGQYRFVQQPMTSTPVIFMIGFTDHWMIMKALTRPLHRKVWQIKVSWSSGSPVEMDLPIMMVTQAVLDHAFHLRKAGTGSNE